MVKVTPIQEDEAAAFFEQENKATAAAAAEDDNEYSDVDSESSEEEEDLDLDDDFDIANETIAERIIALKDAIPPSYRYRIASLSSSVTSVVHTGASFTGKALWAITTSSLLLGVPLALSIIGEQQLIEMEREMKMGQATNEVLAPGAGSGFQQAPAA